MGSYDTEDLRDKLLSDVYAGATAGMPAMILDESRIRNASDEELKKSRRNTDIDV